MTTKSGKNESDWVRKRRARERKEYEAAVASLPDYAPSGDEISWIRNHPAMGLQDRNPMCDPIILLAKDILKPPHGPAPSKHAAQALQHWCNRSAEFYKIVLTEDKKKTKETADKTDSQGQVITPEIKDIDSLLAGIDGAVPE